MDRTTVYIFVLLLFLIAVVYYVGTSSVGLSGAKAFQQVAYALTGRTNSGSFAGYPNANAAVYSPTF